ncbi:Glutamate synthase [NADPH] large chain [hydrothermal vent metagenome]|uniref:Glutamate synthase [NADPH] large chain n=1 Tax=hydrothermal vent metagenome TaxID=652676 RepID=A0A3B1A7V0_9ZZZZ
MMAFIRLFREQGCSVTFASAAKMSIHMADLSSLGVSVATIELNSDCFDLFVTKLKPDVVLFDRFMTEEQYGWRVAEQVPDALRILDMEDLHTLRLARQKAAKQQRPFVLDDLAGEVAFREIAAIYRCDLSLVVSDYEMQLLTEHFKVPIELLHHQPFMLEPPQAAETMPSFEQRQHFITIGNFRHPPNWDSVLWLKQSIWPVIRQRLPKAELHIYGAYPPPKATQLHNPKQGFQIKGWVEDAMQVMRGARVCLAPLRFGAGIKGKLADAMSQGTPNVTTTIGVEAMQGQLPWGGLVADDVGLFVNAAVQLYDDQSLWQQKQAAGFSIIEQFFDKATRGEMLWLKVEYCLAQRERRRLDNFTGQMLQHHQYKSTQYMSQWIAEKQKR